MSIFGAKEKDEKKDEALMAETKVIEPTAYDIVDALVTKAAKAQKIYAGFAQEQYDTIFRHAAMAANHQRIPLAKMAVEETRMGIMEDKVIKNQFAAEFIYNKYKNTKTKGVIEDDKDAGIRKVAEPVGIIAAVIPTTNPTSTAIFKTLLALKTGNAVVISPHPRAKKCTKAAADLIMRAAVEAGAPDGLIQVIEEPTVEASNILMKHPKIALILATGGPAMVKAAYSSGKPALGVGAGNTPAVIEKTADIQLAVNSIVTSKTFDNGVICASEQSVIADKAIYDEVIATFKKRGVVLVTGRDKAKLAEVMFPDGKLNAAVVGQKATKIAEMAGLQVPANTKILLVEAEKTTHDEPFAHEKLSPVLAMYRADDYLDAVAKAAALVELGGMGHTASLYTAEANASLVDYFQTHMKAGRVLVNTPSSHGAIGDIFNFKLEPSLTLGCGTWGGNSISENVGVKHLMNVKTVAFRRENTLWFRVPPKIFFKRGSIGEAFKDLKGNKRAFIVTDRVLKQIGVMAKVTEVLEAQGIAWAAFDEVEPDPTLAAVNKGLLALEAFKPDVIIALGGGSPIDAAKVMWHMYENPGMAFEDIAMRFMDIRKRICAIPEGKHKATFVAVPTTSGTGSEVTPFAVITDEKTGIKYPLADYALTPDMAVVDPDFVMAMPTKLAAYSGLDAVTHAIEALASVVATEFTDGIALESLRMLFTYLPRSIKNGANDPEAREKIHYASTMAGMAFANAFLGICHSMAHKMGSALHLPHGLANALLINEVIKYNATEDPEKMPAFAQYKYPQARERYARIATYLELGGKDIDEKVANLVAAIDKLKTDLDVPLTIKGAGIDEAAFTLQVPRMAELAFDDQCTGANPRYPLVADLEALYLKAYHGN